MSDVLPNVPVGELPPAGPATDADRELVVQDGRAKQQGFPSLAGYVLNDPRLHEVVLAIIRDPLGRAQDAAIRASTSEENAESSARAAEAARQGAGRSELASRIYQEKAADEADQAEEAADRAEGAKTAALAKLPIYDTPTDGRAATATGESFSVWADDSLTIIDVYENMGASAAPEHRGAYPNVGFVQATRAAVDQEIEDREALIHVVEAAEDEPGGVSLTNSYGLDYGDITARGYSGNAGGLIGIPDATFGYVDAQDGDRGLVLVNSYGLEIEGDVGRALLADALSGIPDAHFSYVEDPAGGGLIVTNSYGLEIDNADDEMSAGPASVTPIVGPDLFAIKGREMAVYLDNIQAERRVDRTALLSIGNNVRGKPAFARTGAEMVAFDAAKFFAAETELVISRTLGLESPPTYRRRMMRQHSAPATLSTRTIYVLLIGDSIWWLGMAEEIRLIFADQYPDVTLVFVGTFRSSLDGRNSPDNISGPFAEARAGSAWEDLIYLKGTNADQQPVPLGQEAAYLAGTLGGGKVKYSPFLRASSGPNSRHDYEFDMAWWLSTYGPLTPAPYTNGRVAVPDVVLINHGMNTIVPNMASPATAAARCREGRQIVTQSIRAACPSAAIGCCMTAPLRQTIDDELWPAAAAVYADMVDWAENEAAADGNMWMINAHMHQSLELGVDLGAGAPDAHTGVLTAPVADALHPGGIYRTQSTGRSQVAQAAAAFIAAASAGV
jgi:hypothetical protein